MAGVNMRLEAGAVRCVSLQSTFLVSDNAYRELHWHKTSEVSYSCPPLEFD